jgi:hypothetical protein
MTTPHPHRAAAVQLVKQQLQLRTLRSPSRSPDMNLIEHVWSHVKKKIESQPPQNLTELREAMVNCWRQLPQDYLCRLVLGMPRRVNSLLLARGIIPGIDVSFAVQYLFSFVTRRN